MSFGPVSPDCFHPLGGATAGASSNYHSTGHSQPKREKEGDREREREREGASETTKGTILLKIQCIVLSQN